MTVAVTVSGGVGVASGPLVAFDGACTLEVSGLAAAYDGQELTAWVATPDGRIKMAAATGAPAAGAVSLVFDLDTDESAAVFLAGGWKAQSVRVRAVVTATDEVAFDCLCTMEPGARAGVTL